ncbi:hypothetical protein MMC07_006777 [Pseudocyphellaria aurata]|nr:hypothetical protein [Pseudocyphellaria aurata]
MSPPSPPNGQAVSRSHNDPRSWARRRFSSFFHGDSVVTSVQRTNSANTRKAGAILQRSSRMRSEQQAPGLRSPTSTRSLIDPSSSPMSTTRSISPDTFERFRSDSNRPVMAHLRPETTFGERDRAQRPVNRVITRSRQRAAWPGSAKGKGKRRCLPNVRNPRIRSKLLGCLISGGSLAVMLTIYIALAISKSIEAKAWNVIIIILILVNATICCHYLIRLCMVALHARKQHRVPSEADENGFAQPQRPIRVILARDEELGLHDNEDGPICSPIPPPPPAYGLWRCSVRADPNLIHWQRTGQPGVQEEARALLRAGKPVNRPPSYTEEGSLCDSPDASMLVPPLFHRANTSTL